MSKFNVSKFVSDTKMYVSKHSPEILTGIGIAGMITTTILAVNATPKALMLIEDEKDRLGVEKLKPAEVVKVAWKPFVPVVLSGAASITCVVSSSSISKKRTAAFATAYKLSEEALSLYKEKVVETIGEKKEQVVRDKVNEERLASNPVSNSTVIVTEKGKTRCFDVISGRYFDSDIEIIRRAVNNLNKRMIVENYISLSEFYDELGLAHIKNSDELGWNLHQEGFIEIDFGSHISDDGQPCIVLDYMCAPRYEFQKLM